MNFKKYLFLCFISININAVEITVKHNINSKSYNETEIMKQVYGLVAIGDDDNALLFLNKVIANNSNNVNAKNIKADILYKQNKFYKSKKELQDILKISKNNIDAIELLAKIFFKEGNLEKTKALLSNVKNQNLSRDSYKILSKIYEKQGNCDMALGYLQKSQGLGKNNLAQAMLIKRCLGDNAVFVYGDNKKLVNGNRTDKSKL